MLVELSVDHIDALLKACRFQELLGSALDVRLPYLRAAQRILASAERGGACRHCDTNPGHGARLLCLQCAAYERKTGALPSEAAMIRRNRRAFAREHARAAS